MAERPKEEIIFQHNEGVIEKALNQTLVDLLSKIDLPTVNLNSVVAAFFHSRIESCKLMGRDGNFIDAGLKISCVIKAEQFSFVIDVSFPDNLDDKKINRHSHLVEHFPNIHDELISFDDHDIAFKYLHYYVNKDTSDLEVSGNLRVRPEYRELGIGVALLKATENVKMPIAKKLAEVLNVTQLKSLIEDSSKTQWTTRQIGKLVKGYSPGDNPLFNYKTEQIV